MLRLLADFGFGRGNAAEGFGEGGVESFDLQLWPVELRGFLRVDPLGLDVPEREGVAHRGFLVPGQPLANHSLSENAGRGEHLSGAAIRPG